MNLRFVLLLSLAGCGVDVTAPSSRSLTGRPGPLVRPVQYLLMDGDQLIDLATGAAVEVSSLELVDPALDALPKQDGVLMGRLDARRSFHVEAAWRALPGTLPTKYDSVYKTDGALGGITVFVSLTDGHVVKAGTVGLAPPPFVNEAWLRARIASGTALVAGRPAAPDTLNVAAVLLRLPEVSVCPLFVRWPSCDHVKEGVATFRRGAERCLEFDACVRMGPCPEWLVEPSCQPGYVAVPFATAPNGCTELQCDPDFAR